MGFRSGEYLGKKNSLAPSHEGVRRGPAEPRLPRWRECPIEYRFADGEMGRLSELVTDLVGLGVEPQRRLASSCHQRF